MKHATGLVLLAGLVSGSASAARVECGESKTVEWTSNGATITYDKMCYWVPDREPPVNDGPTGTNMGGIGPDGRPRRNCDPEPALYSTGAPICKSCEDCKEQQDGCLNSAETDYLRCLRGVNDHADFMCGVMGRQADGQPVEVSTFLFCPAGCDPTTEFWCVGQTCQNIPIASWECRNTYLYGMPGQTGSSGWELGGEIRGTSGKVSDGVTIVWDREKGLFQGCDQDYYTEKRACVQGGNSCAKVCNGNAQ